MYAYTFYYYLARSDMSGFMQVCRTAIQSSAHVVWEWNPYCTSCICSKEDVLTEPFLLACRRPSTLAICSSCAMRSS